MFGAQTNKILNIIFIKKHKYFIPLHLNELPKSVQKLISAIETPYMVYFPINGIHKGLTNCLPHIHPLSIHYQSSTYITFLNN